MDDVLDRRSDLDMCLESLPLAVRLLPASKICDNHHEILLVDCVKQSVFPDSVAVEIAELTLQSLDVRPEVRLATKHRVHDLTDSPVQSVEGLILANDLTKCVGLCDSVLTRQPDTVCRRRPSEPS